MSALRVGGQRSRYVGVAREGVRQDDRVLDGLAAALAHVGRHRVGGVTEQGHPAGVESGQGRGQFVKVVVEYVDGFGVPRVEPVQQRGYRMVPRTEAPGQFRMVVGRLRTGAGGGGGVEIDPAVDERDGPEPLPRPQVSAADRAGGPMPGSTARHPASPA